MNFRNCLYEILKEEKQRNDSSNTDEFIKKSKDKHGDSYDYSKVNYKNNKIPVTITCSKHGDFQQRPTNHLLGRGCPKCGFIESRFDRRKGNEDFIKDSIKKHGDSYDYSKVEYVNAVTPVTIICPKHGEFQQKPNNHTNGQGCPICKESKGEKFISKVLKSMNIEYKKNHKFKDCTNTLQGISCKELPFDFYIPSKNTCIEFDGIQHFKPSGLFGANNFEKTVKYDKMKNEYCKNNNIKLIRITYKEYDRIEEILINNL